MATRKDSNALTRVYQDRIGEASTAGEVYGYWLFVLGLLAGLVGIVLVMTSNNPGAGIRGGGIALAALGLILLLVGQIIRLLLKRTATTLSLVGATISVLAVAWFVVAFSAGNWSAAFGDSETLIIGLYGLGVLVMAAGSIFTPLLTGRDREQAAAEARAGRAEAKRDAAMNEIDRRRRQDNQDVADARREQAAAKIRAGRAEAKRDAAMDEIDRRDEADARAAAVGHDDQSDEANSQSQFELYTDRVARPAGDSATTTVTSSPTAPRDTPHDRVRYRDSTRSSATQSRRRCRTSTR
jgi:hypothetical protein